MLLKQLENFHQIWLVILMIRLIFLINYYQLIDKFQSFVKFSKTEQYKTVKSGEFLGPLLKTGLPLMKNLLKPLAKGVLIPSGLTAAVATDTGINQNLRIRDENTNNLKQRNRWYHENSYIFWRIRVIDKRWIIIGASLLRNLLTGKGIIKCRERIIRVARTFNATSSFDLFWDTKISNESKFSGVYSRNNLPEIKDGAYVINLDECKSIGTHWIFIFVKNNLATYFDSFGVENIPKEIEKLIGKKHITRNKHIAKNIYRIQAYTSIRCEYFFIGFIDFMVKDRS